MSMTRRAGEREVGNSGRAQRHRRRRHRRVATMSGTAPDESRGRTFYQSRDLRLDFVKIVEIRSDCRTAVTVTLSIDYQRVPTVSYALTNVRFQRTVGT